MITIFLAFYTNIYTTYQARHMSHIFLVDSGPAGPCFLVMFSLDPPNPVSKFLTVRFDGKHIIRAKQKHQINPNTYICIYIYNYIYIYNFNLFMAIIRMTGGVPQHLR